MTTDSELAILESIYGSCKHNEALITQRDLAKSAGLSLGMTNAVLKRFIEKGWLLARKINSRTIQYALTPEGVNEIAHRTYRYFKRTARNVSVYKDIIEEFVAIERKRGIKTVVLAGASDLDFIIEYICERNELVLVKSADATRAASHLRPGTVVLLAESVTGGEGEGIVSLKTLITGTRVADAVADTNAERE